MPALNLAPALSFFSALNSGPLRPLHTFVRTTEERFRPPQISAHQPAVVRAQDAVVPRGVATTHRAQVQREIGSGRAPTIVLGGLVPDATEQVFLLRRFLLRRGDVYYVQFPRTGFSLDVICAQLSDLTEELAAAGQPPVIFGVSFGAGVALEWLRRARLAGLAPALGGLVLVSPVTCVEDLIAPGAVKPATLIGRALKPFLASDAPASEAAVEKSRAIFLRMFEAGAQNKQALRLLMTPRETERLRAAVMGTIRGVTWTGAHERVRALAAMRAPTDYFVPGLLPLTEAPALVLFAECEEAVLDARAPVRFVFERALHAYFPHGKVVTVKARAGQAPVQHASLIFHAFEFLPPLQAFYQRLRRGSWPLAA